MGNSSKASSALDATRRRGRKKKGRPSLLDLQKRSLRLQKQQEEQESLKRKRRNPNPSPSNSNPYLRFPNSGSGRRSTRRNPNTATSDQDEDEEDDENTSRKEKKLRLVLDAASNSPDRTEREANCSAKATDGDAEPSSEPGPTTPLPDRKLLIFILERLQKKDSYGVFSEPVDPDELPDYHDIIEHPMDFGTVRKKLDKGEYANLEQFESDILLICSNAMVYNASDTIYYRQARTIQELAKKDFANLRAESEHSEQEPKPAPRRGRPPTKKIGRPPAAERVVPDPCSDVGPSNAGPSGRAPAFLGQDLPRKQLDKAATLDPPKNLFGLRILENNWSSEHRSERNDDFSGGFGYKGGWSKWGKKLSEIDESRRSTYDYPILSDSMQEPPIIATFDGERKALIPVGIHQPHAYSLSLARFAAKLSPTAWGIVAKRIEQVLPPGTKFGRGFVGETEGPHQSHPPQLTASPATSSPQPNTPPASCSAPPTQLPSDQPHPTAAATNISGTVAPAATVEGLHRLQPNPHFQLNGFHASLLGNISSQVKNGVGNIGAVLGGMNHGHSYGGGSGRSQMELDGMKYGGNNGTLPMGSLGGASRSGVAPPDLNVGFQSPRPGSPRSAGVVVDKQQQQTDLALQL